MSRGPHAADAEVPSDRPEPPDVDAVVARASILECQVAAGIALLPYLGERDAAAREGARGVALARRFELKQWMTANGLWPRMTADERRVVELAPELVKQQDVIDVSWMAESLWVLLWALGFFESLPPYDTQAEVLAGVRLLFSDQEPRTEPKLRDRREIERARDVAELWNWRSRTRKLQESGRKVELPDGQTLDDVVRVVAMRAAQDGIFPFALDDDFPAFGRAYREARPGQWSQLNSIAMERHRALNWLCGYAPGNRWDKTPTDT